MKKRIITALILGFILIPVVVVPQLITVLEVLVILFSILASFEILNMYDKEKRLPIGVKILCVFLTVGLYFAVVDHFDVCDNTLVCRILGKMNFTLDIFLMLTVIFLSLMSCMIFVPNFDAGDVGRCFTEILYIGLSFGSFSVLRAYGVRFIMYLLIITITTDIFALVFGLNFGKHKMAPTISPKKSWEGAIGGTAVALVVGFLFLFFYSNFASIFHDGEKINFFYGVFNYEVFTNAGYIFFLIILTICMSICSQIGDLVASKLKRTYGLKDFSNVFPGHGGVLDRFDSALFTSIIFLLFLQAEAIVFPLMEGISLI